MPAKNCHLKKNKKMKYDPIKNYPSYENLYNFMSRKSLFFFFAFAGKLDISIADITKITIIMMISLPILFSLSLIEVQ